METINNLNVSNIVQIAMDIISGNPLLVAKRQIIFKVLHLQEF